MQQRSKIELPPLAFEFGFYEDRLKLIETEHQATETRCIYHVLAPGYSDSLGYFVLCRPLDVNGYVYGLQFSSQMPWVQVFSHEEWIETLVVNGEEVPRFVKIVDEAQIRVLMQLSIIRNGGRLLEPHMHTHKN